MGHAIHFLDRLTRLDPVQVDLAFHLYRTPILAEIVADMLVPEGEDRVALSLEHGDEGPYIVLARGGRFVTALGRGMYPTGRTIIPRSRLDEVQAVFDAIHGAEARVAVERLKAGRYFELMRGRGHLLAQDEFDELCESRGALLLDHLTVVVRDRLTVKDALAAVRPRLPRRFVVPKGALRTLLQNWWRSSHTYQHRAVLAAMEPGLIDTISHGEAGSIFRPVPPFLVEQKTFGAMLRAVWIAARTAPFALEGHLETLETGKNLDWPPGAALSVAAGAAAMPERREELLGRLTRIAEQDPGPDDDTREALSRRLSLPFVKSLVELLHHPADYREEVTDILRRMYGAVWSGTGEGGPAPADLGLEELVGFACAFPEAFDDKRWGIGWELAFGASQFLGELPARALYPTREVLGVLEAFSDEAGVAADLLAQERSVHTPEPITRETRTGRNDPCPCGSGKKYKKCCLRAA